MNIETVNELIASLESAGELSIKESKYLELAKAYQQLAAENLGLKSFGDTLFDMYKGLEISGGGIHDEQSVVCQQAALDAAMSAFEEIETPATDRIYAGIKADGVEQAANECYGAGYICETLLAYAQQLREGAK
ncbi:hypothetical protein [Raoultella ornithinolytica]|uniref:hypothetical protein n=1 Tax=Raoultella ornithinolytica TaxID=54291 RepID=UPI00388D702B